MRGWLVGLALLLLAAAPPMTSPEASLAVSLGNQLEARQNLCLAPHSLVDALTMAGQGASGATRTEFERLLGSLDGAAALARHKQLPIVSANRLWVQRGFPILPEYAKYCEQYFGAPPAELDFVKQPDEAVKTINAWVKKETAEQIPELLQGSAINDTTRLVLTNATTLKAKWQYPFDPSATKPEPFTALDGSRSEVPLMTRAVSFPYFEEPGLQVVEMPYLEAGLSLVVALPAEGQLPALEGKMNGEMLLGWMQRLSAGQFDEAPEVSLSFPKLEVRSNQLMLKQPLMGLGLQLAFSRESDFSGLSPQGDELYIDDVVQATMIRFNEEGTEASAATAVTMSQRSSPLHTMKVNRPFLFFLVHRPTSTVLFSGRVVKP